MGFTSSSIAARRQTTLYIYSTSVAQTKTYRSAPMSLYVLPLFLKVWLLWAGSRSHKDNLPCYLTSQMLSGESDGKAAQTSGPKRSHLDPTSLSWTLSYCQFIVGLTFIIHFSSSYDFKFCWFGLNLQPAASVSSRQEQSEASPQCSLWKSWFNVQLFESIN